MPNTFEIVEVVSVPCRKDVLAVLKVVTGDIRLMQAELSSPQLGGKWRVTLTLPSSSAMIDASRIAVGLDGPPGLQAGMILEETKTS